MKFIFYREADFGALQIKNLQRRLPPLVHLIRLALPFVLLFDTVITAMIK
jgi:hypothetical protein